DHATRGDRSHGATAGSHCEAYYRPGPGDRGSGGPAPSQRHHGRKPQNHRPCRSPYVKKSTLENKQGKSTTNKQDKKNHGRLTPEQGGISMNVSPAHEQWRAALLLRHRSYSCFGDGQNSIIGHN